MYLLIVMPTLVLSPRHTTDNQRLWQAALHAGWDLARPGYGGEKDYAKIVEPVIYGASLFAYHAAEKIGVSLVEPPEDWLTQVPDNFLRREVLYTTLEDAYVLKYPAFVKPAGEKSFPSRVYPSGDELRKVAAPFDQKMGVLVSDPVNFEVEYRCFVLKNRVITASVYCRNGEDAEVEGRWPSEEAELNEAVLFAHEVVYRMGEECPVAFVVDVGKIRDRGWAVVEANPIWGSALYGCDEAVVLRALEHSVVRGRPS